MTRTMHDSTNVSDIPAGATMVAGYIDGKFQTVPGLRKRFPKAKVVTITVLGTPGADVCDTEPGNISIPHAAQWAANEVKAGRKPTLYCMASAWDDVKAAVKAQGIAGKVSYWIAQFDGKAVIPKGAVAKQFADPNTSGGHFDVSVVADHWPGVDGPGGKHDGPGAQQPEDGTDLKPDSREMAQELIKRLSQRNTAVANGRDVLINLNNQIERVLSID
jgi:hypothetical protein